MNIIEYIPFGHDNPISRPELIRRTGADDRVIRDMLRTARIDGDIVINDGDGYFRYKDKSDLPALRRYYRKERARAFSILENLMPMKAFLEAFGDTDQITLEELGLG